MASTILQNLLAPPSLELSVQKATSALNCQYTSLDQLDELEDVVLQAQARYNDLQSKVNISQTHLDKCLAETQTTATTHLGQVHELSHSRAALSDELSQLSKELVSVLSDGNEEPTLLEDMETHHRNLKELEHVKVYVEVVEYALRASERAVKDVQSSTAITPESLQQYGTLLHFVNKANAATSSVEDGTGQQKLHLTSFLENIRDKTWRDIKAHLYDSLATAVEQLGWPSAIDYASCAPSYRQAFETEFLKLVSLQLLGRKLHKRADFKLDEKEGIYAVEALVQPVSLRFKYHYDGKRDTNRLDKPEWYFTYVLNIAHEHHHFLDTVVQRLLSKSEYKQMSAWDEFCLLLLPLLSRKVKKAAPNLLNHPSLFAHTIYQALIFDAAFVEEGFKLDNTSAGAMPESGRWGGISEVILGNPLWFNAWLQAEKKFVDDQYLEIVSSPDAWGIADEGAEEIIARDVKATNSARRIRALVDQITDRFSPLPSPHERTQFLISVQLPVLELYRARIISALDAFESVSFAFVRSVPGALSITLPGHDTTVSVDTRSLTSGVEGVQRLCKALLSATYIHASLEAWTEEVFFLELWQDILRDPLLKKQAEGCALLPNAHFSSDVAHKTVFDEMMSRYQKVVSRAEDMTVQQVCGEIEAGLRNHFNVSTGSTANASEDGIALSQTLLGPIALLSSHLAFLRLTLPLITLTSLYRRIAGRLSEHILQRQILYRGNFSKHEGTTLQAECELWVETCHTALAGVLGGGRKRVESPWTKLLQAGRLVGADESAWDTITQATFGMESEEDWEKVMMETTGLAEMGREDVSRLLRRRDDC
ncbi:RINT-1 family protein, partial [Ephemerocybe angulata]